MRARRQKTARGEGQELVGPGLAWRALALLKSIYQSNDIPAEVWVEALEDARRERIFEYVPPEKPYGSLDAMLRAEIGCGTEESIRIKSVKLPGHPPNPPRRWYTPDDAPGPEVSTVLGERPA